MATFFYHFAWFDVVILSAIVALVLASAYGGEGKA